MSRVESIDDNQTTSLRRAYKNKQVCAISISVLSIYLARMLSEFLHIN